MVSVNALPPGVLAIVVLVALLALAVAALAEWRRQRRRIRTRRLVRGQPRPLPPPIQTRRFQPGPGIGGGANTPHRAPAPALPPGTLRPAGPLRRHGSAECGWCGYPVAADSPNAVTCERDGCHHVSHRQCRDEHGGRCPGRCSAGSP